MSRTGMEPSQRAPNSFEEVCFVLYRRLIAHSITVDCFYRMRDYMSSYRAFNFSLAFAFALLNPRNISYYADISGKLLMSGMKICAVHIATACVMYVDDTA